MNNNDFLTELSIIAFNIIHNFCTEELNVTSPPSVTMEIGKEPDNKQLYIVAGAAAGGVALIILLLATLCFFKHRSSTENDSGMILNYTYYL